MPSCTIKGYTDNHADLFIEICTGDPQTDSFKSKARRISDPLRRPVFECSLHGTCHGEEIEALATLVWVDRGGEIWVQQERSKAYYGRPSFSLQGSCKPCSTRQKFERIPWVFTQWDSISIYCQVYRDINLWTSEPSCSDQALVLYPKGP